MDAVEEVLEEGQWPIPEVAAHQVLVKIIAAALNPIDYERLLGYLQSNEPPLPLAKVFYGASLVVTTASTTKLDFVKSLGADIAIDYTCSAYYDLPDRYDFVFDTVGDSANAGKVVKEGGVVLTIADFNPTPPAVLFVLTPNGADLTELNPYLESGKIKAIIDPNVGCFPFSKVKDAFKYLEAGKAVGKIVIFPIHQD